MLNIGKFLKTHRIYSGMSLSEVSEKLKISKSHLCDIEKNRRHLSKLEHFNKLCDLYSILEPTKSKFLLNVIMWKYKDNKDSIEFDFFDKYLNGELEG